MAGPFQLGPQFPPPPQAKGEPPIPISNTKDFLEQKSAEADLSAVEKILVGVIGVGLVELGLLTGGKGKVAKKAAKFAIKSGLELGIGAHALRVANTGPGGHMNLPPGIVGGIESQEDRDRDDARRRALAAQESATAGFLKSQGLAPPPNQLQLGFNKIKVNSLTDLQLDQLIAQVRVGVFLGTIDPKTLARLEAALKRRLEFRRIVFSIGDALLKGAGRVFPMWEADP